MDDKKLFRMICKLILFAGAIILGVMYSKEVLNAGKLLLGMLSPFLVGAATAFVLNLPTRFIEQKLLAKWRNPKSAGLKRGVSIVLALLFLVAVIVFAALMVIPQLTKTLMELGSVIPAFFRDLITKLEVMAKEYPEWKDAFAALEELSIDWSSVISYVTGFLKDGLGNVLSSTVGFAGSVAGALFDGVIAFVFAIYILCGKEKLAIQAKKLLHAYLSEKSYEKTLKVLTLCNHNFAKFISGQCLEAIILGTMFVICMTIFGMPYAVLVGVLIAFTALIPIVGAFIGCAVGAFLILMVSPVKALIFIIMFLVLQQLEGNLIYPRVVGNSVGLPAIWVLVAVSVGGSMFGVVGMLVFIPLMSTLYALLKENVANRNRKKGFVLQETIAEPESKTPKKKTQKKENKRK
ncbi:MAG: AI-2E family transporter [Lachnospiraceae bacterium]|nr:AI-2E family transporter [Lachnospiraceae bacterium]